MLQNEDHWKAYSLSEAAVGMFAGLNDFEGMKSAKDLSDAAKKAKSCEDIGKALTWAYDYVHVPHTLVIDPGLTREVGDDFSALIR